MSKNLRFEEMRSVLIGRNRFYSERLRSSTQYQEIPFTTKQELVDDQREHPPYGTNLTFPIEN